MNIVIIDYGAGNIQSIQFSLNRLGYSALLTSNKEEILSADKLILPGVGEASHAMKKLKEKGLDSLIPNLKQPLLGICLGMQLLCSYLEEGDTEGLGIFDSKVVKFSSKVKTPQIGWNQIYNLKSPLFEGVKEHENVYLVHSYYVPNCPDTIANTYYDEEFTSAIKKNNFYGTQFHPEKSSLAGEQILNNFIHLKS
jgi:glutamine amidotransferase